jgi:hypothetical protein
MKLAMVAVAFGMGAGAEDFKIEGDYIEARTCDVWTGPCFANSEMNLRGNYAVAGWIVRKGSWGGTSLEGLKIVAVIQAEGTLHTSAEGKVKAAVYIDEKATAEQGTALLSMARALAPGHLKDIVDVQWKSISYARKDLDAALTVGSEVCVKTRPLCECDSICCNEEQAYPSISVSAKVDCAKTAEHSYQGAALDGSRWSDPEKRSAMVGTFAR